MHHSARSARPGVAAEKLLITPGMRTIPVNYLPDPEPEAPATVRRREAGASARPDAAERNVSDTLRGFLIGAGAVAIIAAGVAVGIYLMA